MDIVVLGHPLDEIILYFFVYSFIGCCIEAIYRSIVEKRFVYPGFLFGPYCPVYGFAAVAMILFLTPLKSNYLLFAIGAFIVTSVFEYIAGAFLENLMHTRLWDYSKDKFNIKGRISLKFSLAWTLLAAIFMYIIQPFLQTYVFSKIPSDILYWGSIIILILFAVDVVLSINKAIRLRKHLSALQLISVEIKKTRELLKEKIDDAKENPQLEKLQEKYHKLLDTTINSNRKFLVSLKPNLQSRRFPEVISNLKERLEKLNPQKKTQDKKTQDDKTN